jgi:hypothetical protein
VHEDDVKLGAVFLELLADRGKQMRLAQPGLAVYVERVINRLAAFCRGVAGGISKLVAFAYYERIEGMLINAAHDSFFKLINHNLIVLELGNRPVKLDLLLGRDVLLGNEFHFYREAEHVPKMLLENQRIIFRNDLPSVRRFYVKNSFIMIKL